MFSENLHYLNVNKITHEPLSELQTPILFLKSGRQNGYVDFYFERGLTNVH